MIGDIDTFRKMYYGDFRGPGFTDIVYILIVLLPFFVIYLYVRFIENRLITFVNFRLIPFIRYKMRLDEAINFTDRILNTKIFYFVKNR